MRGGKKKEKSWSVISKTARPLDRMALVQHMFYFALQISLKHLFPTQHLYNYVRVTQNMDVRMHVGCQ
jgi:hypothetical protein